MVRVRPAKDRDAGANRRYAHFKNDIPMEFKPVGSICEKVSEGVLPKSLQGPVEYVALENIVSQMGKLTGRTAYGDLSEIKSQKTVFAVGDILFGKLSTNLDKVWLADRSGICSTDIFVLRADEKVVHPVFLESVLRSNWFNSKALAYLGGSLLPRIGWKDFSAIEIPLIPLELQHKVAVTLSDTDVMLEDLESAIAKKRLIKKGAMQDLFATRRRLPGHSRNWRETSFRECFDFMRSGTASRSMLGVNLGIGYLHYGDIHAHNIQLLDLSENPPLEIACEEVKKLSRLQDGDIVFADASEDLIDIGKSVEIKGVQNKEVVAGLHTFLLRGKPGMLARGFGAYIQFLPDVRARIEKTATASSVYGISKSNLAKIRFRLPPPNEQAAIAQVLFDMDAEIQTLEHRLAKMQAVRTGMMQNLLTGLVRPV